MNRFKFKMRFSILVLIFVFGGGILYSAINLYSNATKTVTIGMQAPNIELQDLQGRLVKLSDFRGKAVMINFFTSWCPPCIQEAPDLAKFSREHGKQVTLIMVDRGETIEPVKHYIEKYKISAVVLLDRNNGWSPPYGVTGQPESFFIDKKGIIRQHIIGPMTADGMWAQGQKLLNE